MNGLGRTFVAAVCLLLGSEACAGEKDAAVVPAEKLPELARRLKSKPASASPETIQSARSSAAEAARRLDGYLARGGQKYQRDWRRYLQGREAEDLSETTEAPLERLLVFRRQLKKGHEGLDLPIFRRLAGRVDRLVELLQRGGDADQELPGRLEELAALLESGDLDAERLLKIANTANWLEQRGLTPELTESLREHYWRPNLAIEVSQAMVAAALSSKVDDVRPVCDLILGTSITGTGHTTGHVTARLVPSDDRATIDTWFRGQTHSDTMGANGPARIFTLARTDLVARKRLFFTGDGFAALRTTTEANTNANIVGIGSTKRGFMDRIVRRVASKRAAQSKWQSEQISARHAEALFSGRFDDEAGERLAEANRNYVKKVRRPLMNAGAFPRRLRSSTTARALRIDAVQATATQLSAIGAPPELPAGADVGVVLHESLVHNFTNATLAGRTIDDKEMKQWLIDTFGKLPKQWEEEEAEDRDPWSITFASPEPVTVAFDDDHFTITIHGASYTSGENRYQAMDVTADYRLAQEGDKTRALRDGDLKIYPPGFVQGRDRLAVRQQTLRRLLERRFGKIFTEELQLDDLELGGDWKQIGVLNLAALRSGRDWLGLAWTRAPAGSTASTSATWEPALLTALLPRLTVREVETESELEALLSLK